MKKVLIGVGVAVLVVVGAVGAILLTVDPKALITAHQDEISRAVRAKIGRDVTLGAVDGSVLPTLEARISAVSLAGPSAEAKPQVELQDVVVRISLWRAITSLGKDLEVDAVVVRGLTVRARRDAAGVWDFQDVLTTLEQGAPPSPEEKAPETPTDLSFLEGAKLSRVAIEDARVEVDDAMLGRPLAVSDVDLEARDIRLGAPIALSLHAVLEDGAARTPIDVAVTLSELRKDLSFDPVPDVTARAKVAALELGPWAGLLPKDALAPAKGQLSVDVDAQLSRGLTVVTARVDVAAREIVLRQGAAEGAPLTLALKANVDVDTGAARYRVDGLSADGTGIKASGSALVEGSGASALKDANLSLAIADLGRVVAVVPSSAPLLPKELVLEGPLAVTVNGNASDVDLTVNLDDAHVAWAQDFDKQKGRALHLALKGKKGSDTLDIPAFSLAVDTIDLKGALALPLVEGRPLTADVKTGTVALSSLGDLLPAVKTALHDGRSVDGAFTIALVAKAQGEKQDAHAQISLAGLDVDMEGLKANGSGTIDAKIAPVGGTTTIVVATDLSGLALKSVDTTGATVLDKPAGMALRLDVDVVHTGAAADVKKANLKIGATTIDAKGGAKGLDGGAPTLDLDFGKLDVAFDDLRRTLPGASALPAGGRLLAAMKVGGNPNALATMTVDVKGLDLAFGKSHVKGDLDVKNLDAPVVKANLPDILLLFDDLRPLDESLQESLPKGGRFDGAVTASVDTAKLSTLDTAVTLDSLVYDRTQASGKLTFADLDHPRFFFDLSCPELDIDRLLGDDGKKSDDAPAAEEETPSENPHGLPKAAREQIKKVSGEGTLRVKVAHYSGMDLKDFIGKLRMKEGVITFDNLDFQVYGGKVSAAGTELDLGAPYAGYKLKMKTTSIDFGRALADHTSLGSSFDGTVSNDLDLSGRGLSLDDLAQSLTGAAKLTSDALTVKTLDVLGPIGAPLKAALEGAGFTKFQGLGGGGGGQAGAASASSTKGAKGKAAASALTKGTTLQGVNAFIEFTKGRFALKNPLDVKTPFGALQLAGGGALDKSLDFKTTAFLSPDTVNGAVGTQAVKEKIAVPFQIGGTWDRPVIKGVDAGALLKGVMQGGVLGALGANAEDALKAAAAAEENLKKAAADAEKKAVEAANKAKDEAQKKADEAKKAAEQKALAAKAEAEKKAEAAKKEAEKKAEKAKKEAEKKAEKAKKEAEKKAKKKAKETQDQLKKSIGL